MTISQQNYVEQIKADILTAVGSQVGNRVHNIKVKQDSASPYIIFNIVADTMFFNMGKDDDDIDFQVLIVGKKKIGAKAIRLINDDLIDYLHRLDFSGSLYPHAFYRNTLRGITTVEDDVVAIRSEYNIFSSA